MDGGVVKERCSQIYTEMQERDSHARELPKRKFYTYKNTIQKPSKLFKNYNSKVVEKKTSFLRELFNNRTCRVIGI